MKTRLFLFSLMAVVLSFFFCSSAPAITLGQQTWFKIAPSGNISVSNGGTLSLTLQIKNNYSLQEAFASIEVVVINPATGARVYGPQTISQSAAVNPGSSTSVTLGSIGPISASNATLAAIITVQDSSNIVRGISAWGFVTTQ